MTSDQSFVSLYKLVIKSRDRLRRNTERYLGIKPESLMQTESEKK